MTILHRQYQEYKGLRYAICDLINASSELEVEELQVKFICSDYGISKVGTIHDAALLYNKIHEADLSFPIILAPDGFILDGKHRLAKAKATGVSKIKCVLFETMPNCGM